MNTYTIKIEKNKTKDFVMRDKNGVLMGMVHVRENEVAINGRIYIKEYNPEDNKGENKVFFD